MHQQTKRQKVSVWLSWGSNYHREVSVSRVHVAEVDPPAETPPHQPHHVLYKGKSDEGNMLLLVESKDGKSGLSMVY